MLRPENLVDANGKFRSHRTKEQEGKLKDFFRMMKKVYQNNQANSLSVSTPFQFISPSLL